MIGSGGRVRPFLVGYQRDFGRALHCAARAIVAEPIAGNVRIVEVRI
jgi:hypothetical protein